MTSSQRGGQPGSQAVRRWADGLAEWAIPDEILAQAAESPWGHPVQRFAVRADRAVAEHSGPSFDRAHEALAASPGSVLDVGAGAGAASLPLAPDAAVLTAVDRNEGMLAAFVERAAALAPDIPVRTVLGSWPEAAAEAGPHDVVVCHHVLYDVPDVVPFLEALTSAARRRVVVEVPFTHPLSWTTPLWQRFWGIGRPDRPTADDLVAVLHDLAVTGLTVDRWQRTDPDPAGLDERAALVARRLCLPPERAQDCADALVELGLHPDRPRDTVTLAWDGTGGTAATAEGGAA